ncbi:phage major capsid protein [Mycolicibacterium fluoranthenivorans]|uniref:Phage major capsid protein, HK97 family n=1 Tax=Mycolicibacterium fluoranthenivorans TaxID=258505 RepID=A0A1G4VFH0_9MYCO|nr:phage major capsid protein [Mycolicibacterium fluoranthenivorans]SCX05952.1 phage major capsid protein, HK97 family [Mycolicibacterium fluoranthenivorans]
MNPKERLAALIKDARGIAEKAKTENRDLTTDEQTDLDGKMAEITTLKEQIAAGEKSAATLAALDAMAADAPGDIPGGGGDQVGAKSLGEHFVKHAHESLVAKKGLSNVTVGAPDFTGRKAAADNHVVGGWTEGVPYLTDFDRTIVQAPRVRLTIDDLLAQGPISGNAISYLVESALEGGFATVAEGGAKPQMHFLNPTQKTDALKKIAGFITLTDEFLEDADFLKTEIDTRLLYELAYMQEQQLLNGNGTGQNLLGVLNRSGLQTEASAGPDDNFDAVFRGMTKVETNGQLPVDGLVIHPNDYQRFRLTKDGNQQYYGGGPFAGQYANDGLVLQPPLWAQKTVVTPAIAEGTVAVGSWKLAATAYRKGGVRVEAATQHASNFTNNLVTIRAEVRRALAVRKPLGFCKVALDWTA